MIEIRYSKIDDINDIQELYSMFYFIPKKGIEDDLRHLIVCEKDSKVVGLIRFNSKLTSVQMIVVDKKHRTMGIGKTLFEEACKMKNVNKSGLSANATYEPYNSVPFWKKIGFIETGNITTTKHGNKLMEMKYDTGNK